MILCLFGCKPKKELDAIFYCAVTGVEKKTDISHSLWVATCSDGSIVVFPGVVQEGEGVYYTPYWEGDDAVTVHGYIKKIERIL